MPTIRQVPLLQPLNTWALTRICMCSITHRQVEGQPPTALFNCQDEFAGVYVVISGGARLSIPEDHPITPTGDGEAAEGFDGGALVAIGGWTVTALDLFGFEAAFATHKQSPVSARPLSSMVCLQVSLPVSDSHVVAPLKESLQVEARSKIKEAKSVITVNN